jgi:hypothetical protein
MRVILIGALYAFVLPCFAQSSAEYKKLIETIERSQKEIQALGSKDSGRCWDCVLQESKLCGFREICEALRSEQARPRLMSEADGTYVPNYKLNAVNDQLNMCRQKVTNAIPYLPDAAQETAKQMAQNQRDFFRSLKKNREEGAYVRLSEVMLDAAEGNGPKLQWEPGKAFDYDALTTAYEKQANVKLSPESRKLWMKINFGAWSVPEVVKPIDITDDPLFSPSALMTENKGQERYQKNLDRIHALFQDERSRVIDVLKRKTTPENKAEMGLLIERMKTVKMRAMLGAGECSQPNAFYRPGNHSFVICPQLAMLPDDSLALIIAHELGHAIDPCTTLSALSKSKKIETYSPFKVPDTDPFDYSNNDDENQQKVVSAISVSTFPLNKTVTCLTGEDSVNADTPKVKENFQKIRRALQAMEASGGQDLPEAKMYRDILNKADNPETLARLERCGKGSQVGEAFADWIATEAEASRYDKEGPPARKRVLHSTAFFAALGCYSNELNKQVGLLQQCALVSVTAQNPYGAYNTYPTSSETSSEDPHPFDADRMDKVFLAHPKIREALGCGEQTGVKHCD